MPDVFGSVVRPLVTEKSSAAFSQRKEYTFAADPRASKRDIRQAIETMFGVTVTEVRTSVQRSKRKTQGRTAGRRPRWKKAYVRLKDGDSIEIFEG